MIYKMRRKRQINKPAERAVEYIVRNPGVTYGQAAHKFGVKLQQVRGRVISRWGGLGNARLVLAAKSEDLRDGEWARPCNRCRSAKPRPYGQYTCDGCKKKQAQYFEGAV